MEIVQASAITFAMSQLVLSAILLFRAEGRQGAWSMQRRLYGLLLIAIVAYLMVPVTRVWGLSSWMTSLSTAVPGMFWLFSASLFDDHFRLRRWQVALVSVSVFLPMLGKLASSVESGLPWLVFYMLPQALEFVMLALTLLVVARFWKVDLIESRRRLRLWFCGLNGVYIFLLILFREVLFPGADWLTSLQYLPVGLMLLATNAILLEYRHGLLDTRQTLSIAPAPVVLDGASEQPAAPTPVIEAKATVAAEVDPELVARLQALVEAEGAYREMGLTIGQLASQLEIPEYRLRQTINAGLGYRNFNDFLNSYRVKEAAERLADPTQKELPVLTIALDIGFRSLSSFNKAFKSTYQTTPTAFRKSHLPQSE
ncbi:helix-turn-helix domain-containing protein [Oceanicoccus sagamiensis]|uniref:HTH araC/xylS-type domain-containing protein n=1 Tax=Oceanicoccus sagamiensis TaxID=716816 RepID=A0A1X9N827_9GAMM|nr:helix-turn-helix domain-containing protein [Oceanicoccus sagamiensis]ARN73254.1 hypothetical protein BST96_03510 [Oceanicoccus sagamiensis]